MVNFNEESLEKLAAGCGTIISAAAVMFLMVWLFQLAWNWLVPVLFNGPEITYWQMFILKFLITGLMQGSYVAKTVKKLNN